MDQYFSQKDLLKAPISRAAFSDRMAYVMAEMSRIAYFKFEGGHTIDQFVEQAKKFINKPELLLRLSALGKQFISQVSPEKSKNIFSEILKENGYTLVDVFNNNGTQGFLCKHEGYRIAILAFRGTEVTEYSDIKSDIDAKLIEVKIGDDTFLIHSGFWKAFDSVKDSIEESLKQVKDYQLFFTGHSLGGALATIAVRYFCSDSSGACYTFGAPPVGTKKLEKKLKTPLYRIVNDLDVVPNMPNPWTACFFIFLFSVFNLFLNFFKLHHLLSEKRKTIIKKMFQDFSMYRHIGYGSVLMGTGKNPILRYQMNFFDALLKYKWILFPRRLFKKGKRLLADHKIDAYSEKLKKWALNRKS